MTITKLDGDKVAVCPEAMQPTSIACSADKLAELIRQIDGNHDMGAGALAEALLPHLAAIVPPVVQAPWRCFHCGEECHDAESAAHHFGSSERQEPICFVDQKKYRELQLLSERYQAEDTDLHRELYGLRAAHAQALIREEEKGYARALRDTNYQEPVAAPIVVTVPSEPVAWMNPNEGFCRDAFIWGQDPDCSPEYNVPVYLAAPSPTEQASDVRNAALTVDIEKMVNRFLSWKLPQTFAPDCGILFKQVYADSWPTGTNLFHAGEAKAMFQHCLDTPADKGNAPEEAITRDIVDASYMEQIRDSHAKDQA